MSDRILVVVPAYGRTSLTHAVVRDVACEDESADVLIVDNQGDYTPVGEERILRPGRNVGWLRACNLGMRDALARRADVVVLNNDTRLSDGFFAGLRVAAELFPRSVIAPSYDDRAFACQHQPVVGGVAAFRPRAEEVIVPDVDGTCVLVPHDVMLRVGELDEQRFGRHGWGGMDDYCLRVRRAGGRVVVTRRSFLEHARATTARTATTRYEHFAAAEMEIGMVRKYGLRWRRGFDGVFVSSGHGQLALSAGRYVQERLGLGRVEWRELAPGRRRRQPEPSGTGAARSAWP
jgi:GT2 family glycosyltransferase